MLSKSGFSYGIVLHGAEVTVPGFFPGSSHLCAKVLSKASFWISAGEYAENEARKILKKHNYELTAESIQIPPGVDTDAFRPASKSGKNSSKAKFELDPSKLLVLSVSRLVPRKGMDTLIKASGELGGINDAFQLAIVGRGRDLNRLKALSAAKHIEVKFLGGVSQEDLAELYSAADIFVMNCRDRWFGLEKEGFGIVFLEAAASGVAQIAGNSGGAQEAVIDGVTGFVVKDPSDVGQLRDHLGKLLTDDDLRLKMSVASLNRSREIFDYKILAEKLAKGLGRY